MCMSLKEELLATVKEVQTDTSSLQETAEGWLHWFHKRGDKYLKDAAKLGYTEATLDLPIEIAKSLNLPILSFIRKRLREMLDGCIVEFLEDEYHDIPICRVLIKWE